MSALSVSLIRKGTPRSLMVMVNSSPWAVSWQFSVSMMIWSILLGGALLGGGLFGGGLLGGGVFAAHAMPVQVTITSPPVSRTLSPPLSLRAIVVLENEGRALLEGAICPGDCDGLDFRVRGRAEGLYLRARQWPRLLRVCLRLRRLFTLGKYLGLLGVCGRTVRILVCRLLRTSRKSEHKSEHERSNCNAHEKSALHTPCACSGRRYSTHVNKACAT
jgi:hypothetical protein